MSKVHSVNPIGSGDSVVAGFAIGLSRELAEETLIKFGLTMGVLNAMEKETGDIDSDKVDWCIKQMNVGKLS